MIEQTFFFTSLRFVNNYVYDLIKIRQQLRQQLRQQFRQQLRL